MVCLDWSGFPVPGPPPTRTSEETEANNLVFPPDCFPHPRSKMHLPIKIDDVLHGQAVEWERLEFKQG